MIHIVDYKLNNLRSIENTLRRLGHEVRVTSNPEDVRAATKLILPGVGAFGDGMREPAPAGLVEPFIDKVKSGVRHWASASECICCSPRAKSSDCIAAWTSFRDAS